MADIAGTSTVATRSRSRRLRWRRILAVLSLTLTLAAVAFWGVVLRPVALGGPADYVIVSGASMLPTFQTGDLAVTLRQTTYRVGDVVVYHVPKGEPGAGAKVIHRVVGGSAEGGYVVQGDNKEGIDPWRPHSEDVVGKVRVAVPRAGMAILFLRSAWGMALVAGLTSLLVALSVGSADRSRQPD